jgi:tetratricopeptide (TPR) repeat protein
MLRARERTNKSIVQGDAHQASFAIPPQTSSQNVTRQTPGRTLLGASPFSSCYLGLAKAQSGIGNKEAATASRQQVIDLLLAIAEEERSVVQWGYLGRAFYLVGRWAEAREALEKVNELRGDDGPTLQHGPRWWYLTMALAKLGETEQASFIYDQLVKEMEESPPNYVVSEYRAEAAELLGIEIETEEESSGQPSAENGIGASS